jgi:hypothetical protein
MKKSSLFWNIVGAVGLYLIHPLMLMVVYGMLVVIQGNMLLFDMGETNEEDKIVPDFYKLFPIAYFSPVTILVFMVPFFKWVWSQIMLFNWWIDGVKSKRTMETDYGKITIRKTPKGYFLSDDNGMERKIRETDVDLNNLTVNELEQIILRN